LDDKIDLSSYDKVKKDGIQQNDQKADQAVVHNKRLFVLV